MIDEVDVLQTDNNFGPQLENVIDYYLMSHQRTDVW